MRCRFDQNATCEPPNNMLFCDHREATRPRTLSQIWMDSNAPTRAPALRARQPSQISSLISLSKFSPMRAKRISYEDRPNAVAGDGIVFREIETLARVNLAMQKIYLLYL